MDSKPQSRQEEMVTIDLMPFLMPVALVISAAVLGLSMYLSAYKLSTSIAEVNINTAAPAAAAPSAAAPAAAPAAPTGPVVAKTSIDDDSVRGDKNKAKIAIVEFSDYECPFCKRFYDDTLAQIKTEYIDTGKAVFVYRDLPLDFHPLAQIQAEGAECAGEQGKYFEMHDAIFAGGGQFNKDALKAKAKEIGLNEGQFNDCIDNGKMTAEVQKDAQDAAAAGIQGTPGFVIGKLSADGTVDGEVLSGAQPFASFKTAIDKQLQ